MIHHSCDKCKRDIDPHDELRYVVKMEINAVAEPAEVDDEPDHLMEVHEILEQLTDSDFEDLDDHVRRHQRYDLCSECYRQFIRNPIGRDVAAQLGFSSN